MTDLRGGIEKNDKLVVVGNLKDGYCVYYLIFNEDMSECTPYRYSKLVHATEYNAERERETALSNRKVA